MYPGQYAFAPPMPHMASMPQGQPMPPGQHMPPGQLMFPGQQMLSGQHMMLGQQMLPGQQTFPGQPGNQTQQEAAASMPSQRQPNGMAPPVSGGSEPSK